MKKINSIVWLPLGVLLLSMAHLTLNVELFAWVASVPFLIYLSSTKGFLSRLWFVFALVLSWSLSVGKIITEPLPLLFIPAYSIPIALLQAPAYLVWAKWRNIRYGQFIFPSIFIISEWIQHSFTPLASWGAWAYTQVDNLIIMQLVSLLGLASISFLIHWMNVAIASLWISKRLSWKIIMPLALSLTGTFIYGSIRYDQYNAKSKDTLKVAAVGTDSDVNGPPLPSKKQRDQTASLLFDRTYNASQQGAKLIVWNEAALAILTEEEDALKDSLSHLAVKCESSIVAAYVVLLSESPFRFENKYLLFNADGHITSIYNKHHTVPGEPAVKGIEPIQITDISDSKISGAICYDYDFPSLAKSIGNKKADMVALPSSDWRGIDPIHTKMAAIRAIEQGHSIIRSTRYGLSALINPIGQIAGQQSSFDKNDKILTGNLPENGIRTVYSVIGDLLIYVCITFLILILIIAVVKKKPTAEQSLLHNW